MSLEKLLIFGFALSVIAALAFQAEDKGTKRQTQKGNYTNAVDTLSKKAP